MKCFSVIIGDCEFVNRYVNIEKKTSKDTNFNKSGQF